MKIREWVIRKNPAGEFLDFSGDPCGELEKLIPVIEKAAYDEVRTLLERLVVTLTGTTYPNEHPIWGVFKDIAAHGEI